MKSTFLSLAGLVTLLICENSFAYSRAFRLDCAIEGALYPMLEPEMARVRQSEFVIDGENSKLVVPTRKLIKFNAKGENGRYELYFSKVRKPSILTLDGDPTRLPPKIRFRATLISQSKAHGDVIMQCYSFH